MIAIFHYDLPEDHRGNQLAEELASLVRSRPEDHQVLHVEGGNIQPDPQAASNFQSSGVLVER